MSTTKRTEERLYKTGKKAVTRYTNSNELANFDDDLGDLKRMSTGEVAIQLGPNDELVESDTGATTFRRKIVRQVEEPYTRQVKVPVVTRKVVPTTFQKRIKTKKLVEVAGYEEVEENYTVFQEKAYTREKKIWVQKTVMEPYIKKVPITKTRRVKKPITRIEHVDDFQMVTIPGTKVVEVEGFRIDEVEDRKMVEVEEWEVYELLPHNTGQLVKGSSREIGRITTLDSSRTFGSQVYYKEDEQRLVSRGINVYEMPVDELTGHEEAFRRTHDELDSSAIREEGGKTYYSSTTSRTYGSGARYSGSSSSSSSSSTRYSAGSSGSGSSSTRYGESYTTYSTEPKTSTRVKKEKTLRKKKKKKERSTEEF